MSLTSSNPTFAHRTPTQHIEAQQHNSDQRNQPRALFSATPSSLAMSPHAPRANSAGSARSSADGW